MDLYSLLVEHPDVWHPSDVDSIDRAKLAYKLPYGIIARVQSKGEYITYVESNDQWKDAQPIRSVHTLARLVNDASDNYPVMVSQNPHDSDSLRVAVDWHAATNPSDLFDLFTEVGRMQYKADVFVNNEDCILDGYSGTLYLNDEYIIDRSEIIPFDADLAVIVDAFSVDPHESELQHAIVNVHPWNNVVEKLKRDGWTWLQDGTERVEGCNGMYSASDSDRPQDHAEEYVPNGFECIVVVTNGKNPYETRWSYLIA